MTDIFEQLLKRANAPGNFTSEMGLIVTDISKHSASGEIRMSPQNCNPRGIIHGGVLFSIMDQLSGLAAYTTGFGCVTINGNIDYVRSVPPDAVLKCKAEVVKPGKRVTLCEARIFDGGRLAAKGSFTFCTMEPLSETLTVTGG